MSDKEFPEIGECQSITNHMPYWADNGQVTWRGIQYQHKSLNAEAHCFLPPTKIIPVIFLPGVMGSNLKSSGDNVKKDEPIWRGDSLLKVYGKWAPLKGKQRKNLLNPDTTEVDDHGEISTDIYSLISDDGKSSHGSLFPPREQRGWGEVLNFSYGNTLSVLQAALLDDWQKVVIRRVAGESGISGNPKENGIVRQLCGEPLGTEDKNEDCLTEKEVGHFSQFLYPLHVFGYNWLEDNAVSAGKLVKYIDKILRDYGTEKKHGHGLAIEKVILVTHSMGGLVARYASQVLGANDKILGIVHGVIPDLGSPAAYRRMKVGGKQEGPAGIVMGKSAEELMPVLARAPMQLLPASNYKYGAPWLWVEKGEVDGRYLQLPKNRDPFNEIYLNQTLWWKLYESDIIDKDVSVSQQNWKEYFELMKDRVKPFIEELKDKAYHPVSYAFYGNEIPSDGFVKWDIVSNTYPKDTHESDKTLANNQREIPLPFNRSRIYELKPSNTAGDGTVPIESLNTIKERNGYTIKSVLATNVDHQGAYDVKNLADIHQRPALKFTLRAIAKMVQEVPVCS
ncbi:lipase family alpha/beta hydrolase [Providencia heimbachae]|uniref:Alpha/beta hydrolase n=1 Tax=Providencia heimbachae ATCC 35613 TaxID=1354272 RepID=A0A1B7JM31_9GAMM|nr:acetyltransferase [Providencia heimbachae]OAT48965.1 alpha/beta hydrolase [Providencia heimbachae ATCC 35613]SQH12407.1 PGAP1-like protein [Providencia heimbachae]